MYQLIYRKITSEQTENQNELSLQQLDMLKDVHTANCKETKGLGYCSYCDELFRASQTITDTDASSKKTAKKNIVNNKPSIATKVMIMENTSKRETKIKNKRTIRLDYMELLRNIWHNTCFLQFDAGTMYSTVSGKFKDDIIHQIAESIFEVLCSNREEIQNVPTISIARKI
jgi:hypothetical protein